VNYRAKAFAKYPPICAFCGFGIPDVLEVAHLDGNRRNSAIENLAILCPTCHRMHDVDLITSEEVMALRDRPRIANWDKLLKGAAQRAATARRKRREIRSAAGKKAAVTRKRRAAGRKAAETHKARQAGRSGK